MTFVYCVGRFVRCLLQHHGIVLPAAVSAILLGGPVLAQSQWSGTSGGPIYYNGGNVGIGTTSPQAALDFGTSVGQKLLLYDSGDVRYGFGIAASEFRMFSPGAGNHISFGSVSAADGVTWTEAMRIDNTAGYVGIGTTSPLHMLHVAGTIGAEEVIVSATGADYVFDPNYHLAPLREVAAYVNANHHLPGIPTAEEMKQEGVSLGDMQTKLLAKVEELTLHMIAADERNTRLEAQNRELIERDRELQARIAALEHHAQGNATAEKEK